MVLRLINFTVITKHFAWNTIANTTTTFWTSAQKINFWSTSFPTDGNLFANFWGSRSQMPNFPGPTEWDQSLPNSANILTTLLVTKVIQNEKKYLNGWYSTNFLFNIFQKIHKIDFKWNILASYEKTTFVLVHSFGDGDRFCVSLLVPLRLRQFSPRRNLEKASRHFCRYLCFPQSLNKFIQSSFNGLNNELPK